MRIHLFFGLTIAEIPIEEAGTLIGALKDNADNAELDGLHLHIEDPVEEFMGALAWPPGGCFRTLAGICMRPKVHLYRIGREVTYEDLFNRAIQVLADGEWGVITKSGIEIAPKIKVLADEAPSVLGLRDKVWAFKMPITLADAQEKGFGSEAL